MLKAVEKPELINDVSKPGRIKVCVDSCFVFQVATRCGQMRTDEDRSDVQAGDQHLGPSTRPTLYVLLDCCIF